MPPISKSRAEQLEARYKRMRPVLDALSKSDTAALASFDRRYNELCSAMCGDISTAIVATIEVQGDRGARSRERRVPDYSEALRLLEQEFDDCLPVGCPSVVW
jgi:hypothetical protein